LGQVVLRLGSVVVTAICASTAAALAARVLRHLASPRDADHAFVWRS